MGTMRDDDKLPARLLSGRDEPSVLEQEAIFERVMQGVAPPARASVGARSRRAWPIALAAAAALLLWRPLRGSLEKPDELVARGGGESATLVVGCSDARGAVPCAPGMKVSLQLTPPSGRNYFALLAQRPDGKLVWYYPKPAETTPLLDAKLPLYPEAPLLADDAPAGSYRWLAVFSHEPLTREELKTRLKDDLSGDASVTLIRRTLLVEVRPQEQETTP